MFPRFQSHCYRSVTLLTTTAIDFLLFFVARAGPVVDILAVVNNETFFSIFWNNSQNTFFSQRDLLTERPLPCTRGEIISLNEYHFYLLRGENPAVHGEEDVTCTMVWNTHSDFNPPPPPPPYLREENSREKWGEGRYLIPTVSCNITI